MNNSSLGAARRLQIQMEDQWARRKGRKDAVLHLRIEADIVARVKLEAKAQKLSVSDYVRMRLIDGFSAPVDAPGAPEFLLVTTAWTDAVIMQDCPCAICGEEMPRGTKAWLATGPPPPSRLVCASCYENVLSDTENESPTPEGDE